MKLIITRHGETIENQQGIIQGHLDGKLSEIGIEQAKKLADRLEREEIEYIYSSDLSRALNTTKEISRFYPSVPLEVTRELRERYLGDLQGEKAPENWASMKWSLELSRKFNLETSEEIFERAKNFSERLQNKHYREKVLLVAHNGINQALITYLLGRSWQDIGRLKKLGNTSVTIFGFDKYMQPSLELMDSTKYLGAYL